MTYNTRMLPTTHPISMGRIEKKRKKKKKEREKERKKQRKRKKKKNFLD